MDTIHDILHSVINHIAPHDGNDYRPHLLQRGAMIMMLILILLSFVAANFQALLWQSSTWLVGAVLPAVVVQLTNGERGDLALPALVRNPVLDAAATLKAQDMAKNGYFSHDSPTGVTPWYWFKEAGYTYVHAGENLAVYFTDSSAVVDAWMNSPTHRANIVGSQYREIGVGTAKGMYQGFETVFVVQMFGTPAIPPRVTAPVAVAESPLPIATQRPTLATELAQAEDVAPRTAPLVAGDTSDEPVPVIAEAPAPGAAPAPVMTEESAVGAAKPVPARGVAQGGDNATVADTATPATVFQADSQRVMNATEAVSLYSGLAATSTNLTPAPYSTLDLATVPVSPVAVLATEPSRLLQLIYLALGGITALVLLLSVVLEWRHHRPVQTAYGLFLLLIMAGLFYVHTVIVSGAVVG